MSRYRFLVFFLASASVSNAVAGCSSDDTRTNSGAQADQTGSPVSLIATHSGKCVDDSGWSTQNGTAIIQWPCLPPQTNQQWVLTPVSGGYQVKSVFSGKCLDVTDWNKDNGAKIQQWDCTGNSNQAWVLVSQNNGYGLRSVFSGKCLDVAGWSQDNATQLIQWDCHGGANQTFRMQGAAPSGGGGSQWQLTFSDEFNGAAGPIDDSKWAFDIGGSGWGNNELEYYTNSTDNAALDGKGNLNIVARQQSVGGKDYTSARLKTQGKFSQNYGRFEARIKLPQGKGIWPAFWMLGDDIGSAGWPSCGELDIMEAVDDFSVNHGSMHGPGYSGGNDRTATYKLPNGSLADDFHTYSVEWEPNEVRWYVDGNMYERRTPADIPGGAAWVYNHNFFLLLNVAVGGNWPGSPDGSTQFPQTMQVDYVRVYTKAATGGGGGGPTDTGPSSSPDCASSWSPSSCTGWDGNSAAPDFGPNVIMFDPSMSTSQIQGTLDWVYNNQDKAQFGDGRYAYFFKPGNYGNLDVKVGFYTQVLGLGRSPDDVVIGGNVRVKGDWLPGNNSTCNFWRGAENLSSTPTHAIDDNDDIWAISQGTEMRRMHVRGNLALHDYGGWTSGGFIADTLVDGQLISGSQQQFLTRNNQQNWTGGVWNMVFVGNASNPAPSWPAPPYTITGATPRVREKPFLFLDGNNYLVMVPKMKSNSVGLSWPGGAPPGAALGISQFYIAKPSDSAQTMNEALAAGKNLILTPGIYHMNQSLAVRRPGTIVLGLGIPTLVADSGTPLVSIDDVDDVTIAGVLLEAGPAPSPTLLEVGPQGSARGHGSNPTVLFDVFCRVGGANPGTAKSCVVVNSNDVIIDNMWLWRADHGAGAGWTSNPSANGIIVNGNNVTAYGLAVEHFQEYQTLWNGNGGSVYMYQSEMPYDPPDQGSWQSGPGHNGYPSYKVADSVTSHYAGGVGVYGVFSNEINATDAIEAPISDGVRMTHMVIASLAKGSISHIFNDVGGSVDSGKMLSYSDQ